MRYTQNINLPIVEDNDLYSKEINNLAFEKIDEEIQGLADIVETLDSPENSIADVKKDINDIKSDVVDINEQLDNIENLKHCYSVSEFGAIGDGVTDDTQAIQNALYFCKNSSIKNKLVFEKDKIYMVTGFVDGTQTLENINGLKVPSNIEIDLNGSTIKIIPNNLKYYNVFTLRKSKNVVIKNGVLIGDVTDHTGVEGEFGYGISLRGAENIILENLEIKYMWGDGINLQYEKYTEPCKNIVIRNCVCDSNRRQGMSVESVYNCFIENSKFINTGKIKKTYPSAGIDFEPLSNGRVENVEVKFCTFTGNAGAGIFFNGENNNGVGNVKIKHCYIEDNNTDTTSSDFELIIKMVEGITIDDTKIISKKGYNNGSLLLQTGSRHVIKNSYLEGNIRCFVKNEAEVVFDSNRFKQSVTLQDGEAFIHPRYMTSNDVGRSFIFKNNFVDCSKLNARASIEMLGFYDYIIENNIFTNTKIALRCNDKNPKTIKNNRFINNSNITIYAEKAHIDNNVFEGCSYSVSGALIDNAVSDEKLIFSNNTIYKQNRMSPTRPEHTYNSLFIRTMASTIEQNNLEVDNITS